MAFKMKGWSAFKKEKIITIPKKKTKRVPTSKEYYQTKEDQKDYDRGALYTWTGRPKTLTDKEDKEARHRETTKLLKK